MLARAKLAVDAERIEEQRVLLIIRIALLIAGVLLLAETMLGCIYMLGIGFASLKTVVADFCLTSAFPLYLVGIGSLRRASFSLWLLFVLQSIDLSMDAEPKGFVNPFGWALGDLLFSGAVIMSVATWLSRKLIHSKSALTLTGVLFESFKR